jgi:NAD(P)H-dependent FMN reductase
MADADTLRLQIIIGSTRPNRTGAPVADWFAGVARSHDAFEVDVVDLLEWQLPLLSEPNPPRLGRYTQEITRKWAATIARADAYVIITPEYNYGYTAPVKNALDYLFREWNDKPVGFVSYGGVGGGGKAVQMLKQVVTTLKMLPVFEAVQIPFVASRIGDDGRFASDDVSDRSAAQLLDELARVAPALRTLRVPA